MSLAGSLPGYIDYTMLNRSIDTSYYFSPSPAVSVADIPRERARFFTKADCLLGYHQVPVEESSKDLTTFITEFGRFRYKRVPFGIANIAKIFNRKMEDHLRTREHWTSERRCETICQCFVNKASIEPHLVFATRHTRPGLMPKSKHPKN